MAKIGFIGLGAMGLCMARNLIKRGHEVIGFDFSELAMDAHVKNGGDIAISAAEASAKANFSIAMLPNGDAVKQAVLGPGGVVEKLPKDSLFVDMSTIHPLETDQIRQDLQARDISMVDAPVGRTSVEAEKGESLFMVGAEKNHFKTVQPILACMGDTFIDCGGPGTGSRMKIVNNLMTTSLNVLTAQVLTFSDATGLDRNIALQVMGGTAAGRGHMSTTYPSKVLSGDLEPAFMIDLAKKDLDIAIKFSNALDVPISLAIQAEEIYADAQADGRGGQDWTAIFDMLLKKQLLKS
ncbi:sulfolactaldehyde 3-reductase [Alphaproteobacteria bacterium]|nr:sulfolactaldehyde 3-reductase [Alphaproteobacteria bacterium]